MAIQPTQPQSIGAVLDTSFQLYKASFPRVWLLCLLLVIASAPAGIYSIVAPGTPSAIDPSGALSLLAEPGYWVAALGGGLLSMWVFGALYLTQNAIGTDQELTIAEALRRSLARVLPLFLMSVLLGLALALGFLLLIIPGVILAVSLILAWNLLLLEGKGPVDSLAGSHTLVWGNWWRTLIILSVGVIIYFILYLAGGLIAGLMSALLASPEDVNIYLAISTFVLSAFVTLVASPYYVALLMAIYWDLKLRKEGGDLASRVGALKAA